MERIAILADIHGNLPALEAVLAEPDIVGADLVVLDGDLADGPFPSETLARLEALGSRALWLRGNGDRWLVEARRGRFRHPDPPTDDLIRWAAGRLSEDHLARLSTLPLSATLDVAGLGRVAVCHATGRSDDEMLLVDSAWAQGRSAFAGIDAGLVVVGHSHMPFDRLFDRLRVVNAGSVGLPCGHSGASWAMLGPDVVLRRTFLRCARCRRPHPRPRDAGRGGVRRILRAGDGQRRRGARCVPGHAGATAAERRLRLTAGESREGLSG